MACTTAPGGNAADPATTMRHANDRHLTPPAAHGAARNHRGPARPSARQVQGTERPANRHGRATQRRGFEGDAQRPLASPLCSTRGMLAPTIYMVGASLFRAPFPSFVGWSFRIW